MFVQNTITEPERFKNFRTLGGKKNALVFKEWDNRVALTLELEIFSEFMKIDKFLNLENSACGF